MNESLIEKPVRKSNFELLRIIAMFMIIYYHNAIWGGYTFSNISKDKIIVELLSMFGKIGVNLFALITGFFEINKTQSINKILVLHHKTLFYNISAVIVLNILNISKLYRGGVKHFFPLLFNDYWFVTAFIILYLFLPYMNKLLSTLSYADYKKLIILSLLLWCIIPTITLQLYNNSFFFNQCLWIFVMYIIGGGISRFQLKFMMNKTILWFICFLSFTLICLSVLVINIIALKSGHFTGYTIYFRCGNSILAVIFSVSLFLYFSAFNFSNVCINRIAHYSFDVYLLHENLLFRPILWGKILPLSSLMNGRFFYFVLILTPLIIYIMGILTGIVYDLYYIVIGKHIVQRISKTITEGKK